MMRLAMAYVSSQAIAEEVVQDAWLGVLQQVHSFQGRSSLKTWILRIAVNPAKTRGAQERRSVPFSAVADPGAEAGELSLWPAALPRHRWFGRRLFRGPGRLERGVEREPPVHEHRLAGDVGRLVRAQEGGDGGH